MIILVGLEPFSEICSRAMTTPSSARTYKCIPHRTVDVFCLKCRLSSILITTNRFSILTKEFRVVLRIFISVIYGNFWKIPKIQRNAWFSIGFHTVNTGKYYEILRNILHDNTIVLKSLYPLGSSMFSV